MTKIKPTYVTFEQAKLLKKKGFNIPTNLCYADGDNRALPFNCGNSKHINNKHPYYSAPEQWMVVEWIRLNYGIWIYPYCAGNNKFHYGVANSMTGSIITNSYRRNGNKLESLFAGYSSPQEATSAAFDYVLKELI